MAEDIDINAQIAALEARYEAAVRAEAVARDRAEQARAAETAAFERLAELGFADVAAAEKFLQDSEAALAAQVAAVSADLEGLPR